MKAAKPKAKKATKPAKKASKPVKAAKKAAKKVAKPVAAKAANRKASVTVKRAAKPKKSAAVKGKAPASRSASKGISATEYLIMVPPFHATPGMDGYISRAKAKKKILEWAKSKAAGFFGGVPFAFLSGKEWNIDIPVAGASAFGAKLTPAVAGLLQKELGLFVCPRVKICPVPFNSYGAARRPARGGKKAIEIPSPALMSNSEIQWTGGAISDSTITRNFVNNPVLYVVDSGVQPFVGGEWHPQFKAAIETGKLKIRQGRSPISAPSWPIAPQFTTNVWEYTNQDQPIPLSASPANSPPAGTPPPTPQFGIFSPHLDVINGGAGHGTKITSTAVGATAGFLSRVNMTGSGSVHIESIRIYDSDTAYNSDAIQGIYSAIAAHEARKATEGDRPPSVLLFASRSDVFEPLLELALWWAWYKGLVCVVAAGNDAVTTYPDSRWYSNASGVIATPASTSPSRFDWLSANHSALTKSYWPGNQTNPGAFAGKPIPTAPYLIIVGGSNASQGTPGHAGWWTSTARGRDVDILAPAGNVATARTTLEMPDLDGLEPDNGTSLSAGYVAGVALTYLGSLGDNGTPWTTRFRNWLLPPSSTIPTSNSTIPPTSPCKVETTTSIASPVATGQAPVTNPTLAQKNLMRHYSVGSTKVPKLFIKGGTTNPTTWA